MDEEGIIWKCKHFLLSKKVCFSIVFHVFRGRYRCFWPLEIFAAGTEQIGLPCTAVVRFPLKWLYVYRDSLLDTPPIAAHGSTTSDH